MGWIIGKARPSLTRVYEKSGSLGFLGVCAEVWKKLV